MFLSGDLPLPRTNLSAIWTLEACMKPIPSCIKKPTSVNPDACPCWNQNCIPLLNQVGPRIQSGLWMKS